MGSAVKIIPLGQRSFSGKLPRRPTNAEGRYGHRDEKAGLLVFNLLLFEIYALSDGCSISIFDACEE